MSDPVLGTMAYECEDCGAGAGEECRPDCCGAAVAFTDPNDEYAYFAEPVEELMARLAAAVHRLPFSGNVGIRGVGAPERDGDDDAYIAELANWMTEYVEVARSMVEALQVQSRQRISLQIERDVLDGVIRRALEGGSE